CSPRRRHPRRLGRPWPDHAVRATAADRPRSLELKTAATSAARLSSAWRHDRDLAQIDRDLAVGLRSILRERVRAVIGEEAAVAPRDGVDALAETQRPALPWREPENRILHRRLLTDD